MSFRGLGFYSSRYQVSVISLILPKAKVYVRYAARCAAATRVAHGPPCDPKERLLRTIFQLLMLSKCPNFQRSVTKNPQLEGFWSDVSSC